MDQEPRICPLCGSPVRLFFINFSEKLLMCEDPNCDFPFGYEELQIVADESELRENFDTASSISLGPYNGMSAATSVISTAAWSDIERLNRIYDSEDCMADSRMSFTSDAVKKQRERRKTQKEIQKNLDNIKKLNEELNLLKHADRGTIQKDDWLQNLMTLQGVSGRQLLKEDEIKKLKKKDPDFGMGELKININTVPNDIGLINIEIINENNELQNENYCSDTVANKIQIQLDEIDDMDEDDYIDDQEENKNDKKNDLANNKSAITLNESINTDSNIQETEENENQLNFDINLEEIPSNDILPDLDNINFNEINNLITDSEINCDTNLIDVKTVVINNNSFTLIELKGAIDDINSQNETKNIEGDIQIDSTNTTVDTSILANENSQLNKENINKPNMSEQKEIESAQNHDTIISNNMLHAVTNEEIAILTNSIENLTSGDNLNDTNSNSNLESRTIDKSTDLETSAINKEINLLLETEKLQVNYDKHGTSNIVETNTNSDINIDKEINNESGECQNEENQEDTMNNSKKTDLMNHSKDREDMMINSEESDSKTNSKEIDLINSSKDQEDIMNNSKISEGEVKIPKKRGRPKKSDLMNSSKDQEIMMNNSKESYLLNSSKDQEDTLNNSRKTDSMNNSNELESEGKIPKKRGRPKKGTRVVLEQPLRRSNRFSK